MDIQHQSGGGNAIVVKAGGARDDGQRMALLPIGQVRCFERDPRQSPNPEYLRIRASVETTGVEQPLVVTQRPGDPDYIVAAGGNTRLRVLRELFDESGDGRYAHVHCIIKPWPGESEIMLAHLRENDLRGELTFFDKSRAVVELRAMLEAGHAGGCLSHQDAAEL